MKLKLIGLGLIAFLLMGCYTNMSTHHVVNVPGYNYKTSDYLSNYSFTLSFYPGYGYNYYDYNPWGYYNWHRYNRFDNRPFYGYYEPYWFSYNNYPYYYDSTYNGWYSHKTVFNKRHYKSKLNNRTWNKRSSDITARHNNDKKLEAKKSPFTRSNPAEKVRKVRHPGVSERKVGASRKVLPRMRDEKKEDRITKTPNKREPTKTRIIRNSKGTTKKDGTNGNTRRNTPKATQKQGRNTSYTREHISRVGNAKSKNNAQHNSTSTKVTRTSRTKSKDTKR